MKTGILLLLLLTFVSKIFSEVEVAEYPKILVTLPPKFTTTTPPKTVTTTTKTKATKTLPNNPKSIPYTTRCSTEQKLATITTSINGSPTDVPVYTIVPKSYEHCTKITNVCSSRVVIYDFMPVETAIFTPIECPSIELSQDIVAIADPDQINTPKIERTLTPSVQNVNHTEYRIVDKTLYCYDAQYTTARSGGKHINDCTTTLDPVEIPTEVPVTTAPEEIPTEVPETTAPNETITVETPVPTTTPPKIVTTTTTTTKTKTTKTLPSKSISYTTRCTTEQKFATITTSLNGSPTDVSVYTIVPKSYEHCTKITDVCSGRVAIYDFMPVETAIFTPIECPSIELSQDIIAIADPDQINTPKTERTLTPSVQNVDRTEYRIVDKTLYCYDAQYTTARSGGKHVNDCTTTLEPVEIPTEVPVTTAPEEIPTEVPETTAPEEIPTTTSSAECHEVTVTVKEKEVVTITKKETITVTV